MNAGKRSHGTESLGDEGSAERSADTRSRNRTPEEANPVSAPKSSTTVASVSVASTSNSPGGETHGQTVSDISPESVFETTLGFHQMELDDELILVDVLRDNYLRLNSTATHIWRLVQQRTPLGEVSGQVSQEFGLTPDRAYKVVSSFARDLITAGVASPAQRATHHAEQE